MKESDVEHQVLKYLKASGIFCWKNKSMGTYDPTRKQFRKHLNSMNGVSDILGVLPDGKFLAIEMKRPYIKGIQSKGKPTQSQVDFINRVNENNGIAFVCTSISELKEKLKDYL